MTTTKTDNINVVIQDSVTFNSLNPVEQQCVEQLRNSLLEIFLIENNTVDNLSAQLAENFAYKNLNALKLLINSIIDERLAELD